MNREEPTGPKPRPNHPALELDAACDRFEAAWRDGRRPRAEDYRGAATPSEQTRLLRALLDVELDFRRGAGESPTPDEYLKRFPQHTQLVADAFAESLCPAESDLIDRHASATDSNLLFGLLSPRNKFVSRGALFHALSAWVADKSKPLAQVMRDRGDLDTADADLLQELAQSKRYSLTHLHAKGGMGRVWLARDAELGRQIALKDLRPDQTENAALCSRFLYEAKITAQLEHPGIVPVYELGQGDAPYYTMRFVRGRTLSEAIRVYHKKRAAGLADPVELAELLNSFVAVCNAVAYAHSRGIIHRDLKGQNVVLGDFGEAIVLDWGLAKRIGRDQFEGEKSAADDGTRASWVPPASGEPETGLEATLPGQLLGTPAYMAPEQARGDHERVDQRSDIYGLGAILYEILTGQPPFAARDVSEILRKVRQEQPAPPRQLAAAIAPGLEAICLKAMHKEPGRRYASAAELAHEVRLWLADLPVGAYAEPWTSRVSRWARRHKTPVSAVAGLVVAAAIALAISTVLISGERNEAKAQGRQAREAVHLLTQIADIGFDEQLDPLQTKFLEKALAYYEQFNSRASGDPAVRLEHGRAYQQMGDIERKLGRLAESERSYRRSLEMIEPLAGGPGAGHDVRRALARARALLADLLVRRGADTGVCAALYGQAIEAQRLLADAGKDSAAAAFDRLRLGQTLKSQADLLRLKGGFSRARPVFDKAISELERALAADAQNPECRNALALAVDARGWIHRELGEIAAAEGDFRRALQLIEKLVAEFPTAPRYREALAKSCNSLGALEMDTGRVDDAEAHLRRQVPLTRRLADDFPDRPDYRSILGRALTNLGSVLYRRGQFAETEPVLREAIALNSAITARSPDDTRAQFYLAMSHHDLGEVLMKRGDAASASASFRAARAINEAMAARLPDQPRYQSDLASNLDSLALAMSALGQPAVDQTFRAANAIYERLIAAYPDNVDYRVRQAVCLRNQGDVIADAGRPEQAEPIYQKALTVLDAAHSKLRTPDWQRTKAGILSNLGALQLASAEDALRNSIAISQDLLAQKPGATNDRHHLALAQNNLAALLVKRQRLSEAGPFFTQAITNLGKLVADAPNAAEFHSHFGIVLAEQGKWQVLSDKPADAKVSLALAVEHQRLAVRLGENAPACRLALAGRLIELADINRKLGAYDEAGSLALEVPRTVPTGSRPQACFDAACILVRLLAQVAADDKLPQAKRDGVTTKYLTRAVVLLREAIDSGPALAEQVRASADIRALASRPRFQALMSNLVDVVAR